MNWTDWDWQMIGAVFAITMTVLSALAGMLRWGYQRWVKPSREAKEIESRERKETQKMLLEALNGLRKSVEANTIATNESANSVRRLAESHREIVTTMLQAEAERIEKVIALVASERLTRHNRERSKRGSRV